MNMSEEAMSLITAARRIAPEVLAVRDEAEQARRVPQPLSEIISSAGLYQMFLPASVGGAEAPPLVALQAIEELSKADGSVGWCAMIATDISLFTGWLDPKVVREMCGQPPCLRAAGSLRPMGRAYRVNGGYRVKGQWNFASGIDNANWLYCPCVVMVGEKPQLNAAGAPVTRAMWLPSGAATIKDTWSVMGLRATGSQDFEVNDLIVPENYTSSFTDPPYQKAPLYHPRMLFAFLFALNAGHALGIARGAMDGFVDMAARDTSAASTALLRDRPLVQSCVGQAEAILNAARAYVVDVMKHVWNAALNGVADPAQEIAQARLAITHSVHEAARVVGLQQEPTRSTRVTPWSATSETSMLPSSIMPLSRHIMSRLAKS
jgi:alkylation response protein AidB-like acyl-CoA dehydrogenase